MIKKPISKDIPWHSFEIEAVFSKIGSQLKGLTKAEAERRLAEYGPNRLSPFRKRSPLFRLLSQFNNVLIYVLICAGLITALLGHWVDAAVIFGVVLINGIIGFLQEGKAERALDAIRTIMSQQALVLRDSKKVSISSDRVVPGDIVFLQSGDKVPADLRLFKIKELRIDEAPLTGESMPVEKSVAPVEERTTVGERACMAFSGTLVTFGQGSGVVVATGDATEIGRISLLLGKIQPLTTKLLRQMAEFAQRLTVAIVALAVATFSFGVLVRNYTISDMFLAGVGLAVAAIPEGLPAIITITLAIGVHRMARRNAIIRRLPAVETLGSVTVICSDKTGTLTRNEMMVQAVATADHIFDVSGTGYDPHGVFSLNGKGVVHTDYPILSELAWAALLCNDAEIEEIDGQWQTHGDPTEGALITLAMKAGLDPALENEKFPRTDVIPFESEHRFMATLHHDHAGHGFLYVKGAPERVFEMCNRQHRFGEDQPLDIANWHKCIEQMANRGHRLIAVAFRTTESDHYELRFADVEGGLTLLGVFGLMDPPRKEAIRAVQQCQSSGIRVKMITGDHAGTAGAVSAQMGIGAGQAVVTGTELDAMDDEQLRLSVQTNDVFARVSPEHKLRLVQALQANGEIVAMTGDGVNDAPALKRADVGVAMGIKGTEVAKEAAEMVLTDDHFASIVHAVEEGRTVYDNIKKAITFILPTNAGEAGIIIAAVMSGRLLPITPVQILWINMITAVTLALSLAFEPPEAGVMKRPPRNPREPILSQFLVWRVGFVALILIVGTFGIFLWERLHGASIDVARTVAVNTLVMFEVFYLLNTRYLKVSVLTASGLFGNRYVFMAVFVVIAAQLIFTYLPPMQLLFGVAAIAPGDWIGVVSIASSVFVIVEIEKLLLRRRELKRKEFAERFILGRV